MRRYAPYFAFVAGIVVLVVLMPRFNAAQPRGIRITQHEAVAIADAEARRLGIPVDQAWRVMSWRSSLQLEKNLLGSVRKFTRNRPPEDDQTLVVVSFDALASAVEEMETAYAAAR